MSLAMVFNTASFLDTVIEQDDEDSYLDYKYNPA